MMTKTQQKLLLLFVSQIAKRFSIQGAGKALQMHQALAYRASQLLIERRLIVPDENRLYHLNYKENHHELVAAEYLRSAAFLQQPTHRKFKEFLIEFIENTKEDAYICVLFGSAVEKRNPRDYDLLFFFENMETAQTYERILERLADNYPTLNLHVHAESKADLNEMLRNRDEKNVANEALNKHLLFHGAELFYKVLREVRPYA